MRGRWLFRAIVAGVVTALAILFVGVAPVGAGFKSSTRASLTRRTLTHF